MPIKAMPCVAVRAILNGRKTVTRRAVKPPARYDIVEDEKRAVRGELV